MCRDVGVPAERRNPYWDYVARGAEGCPDGTALVVVGADGAEQPPVTYARLRDLGLRAAGALHGLKVGRGSIVFSAVGNSLQSVALSVGSARLGAVWAPADQDLNTEQMSHLLRLYAPSVAVLRDDCLDAAQALLRGARGDASPTQLLGESAWRALLSDAEAEGASVPPEEPIDDDATSILLLTSGTTGMPKSVMTTNLQLRSLVNIPFLAGKAAPGDGGTCLVYFGSPAWISYTFVFLKAMSGGDALILGQEYSRDLYFNVVERHRPQILFFWPEVIVDFVALPEQTQARLAGIAQVLIYGGARTPASALLHLCQALPATQIHQGYGASECFRVASLTPADHAAAAGGGEAARRRLRSAGRPLGAVRVVDDDGQPVPRGVAGWIQVQPDPTSTFQGYYRNPAATAKKFSGDGWVILGDLGRLDEDGYLYIDGRDSETIVLLSGDNVYPNEVEGAIAELPGVLEVGVAKVVSEEGAISEVGAFIRVCEGSELSVEDIKAQCHKRLGQAWCHPTHIFFQTEKLPRNRNGKCIKAKLTERAAELLQHRLHAQGGA